jgi:uncharacterized membrane protein YadS
MNLEETLFIVVIVVSLNILISYLYPIIHSYLPNNVKNMFSSYQRLILSNRQNLVASSINVIILAVLAVVLTPHIEKLLKMNKQTQPSIFNLANLTSFKT